MRFLKKLKAVASWLACAVPGLAMAGTSVTGHVKDLSIQKDFGTFVFIQLDTPQSSPIACHANAGWTYTLPQQTDADKKILSPADDGSCIGANGHSAWCWCMQ